MCLLKSCPTSADQCLICLVLFHSWTTSPEFMIVWLCRQMIYKLSYNWNLFLNVERFWEFQIGWTVCCGLVVVWLFTSMRVILLKNVHTTQDLGCCTHPLVGRLYPGPILHSGLKPTLQSLASHVAGGCAAISTLFSCFGRFWDFPSLEKKFHLCSKQNSRSQSDKVLLVPI